MDLEGMTPSEISQKERDKYHMIVLIHGILKNNNIEAEWGMVVLRYKQKSKGPKRFLFNNL